MYQARLRAESGLAEAQARESDLMFEIDKLRTAKRGLEAKAAQAAAAAAKFGGDAEGMLRQGEEVGGCTVVLWRYFISCGTGRERWNANTDCSVAVGAVFFLG